MILNSGTTDCRQAGGVFVVVCRLHSLFSILLRPKCHQTIKVIFLEFSQSTTAICRFFFFHFKVRSQQVIALKILSIDLIPRSEIFPFLFRPFEFSAGSSFQAE